MSGIRSLFSNDVLDTAPAVMAFLMLGLASLTFACNRLFDDLAGLANLALPAGSAYAFVAVVIALFPLALLRIWDNSRLKMVLYLSWALFLPSVFYYSGIDPFKILSVSMNFSIFYSTLSSAEVAAIGVVLASGSLAYRSLMNIKIARENLLGRGADKNEAYRAFYRNAIFEMKIIAASAAVVLLIMAGVPPVEHSLSGLLRSASFAYLLAGLCAILLLALIFLIYLWPRKNGEKE